MNYYRDFQDLEKLNVWNVHTHAPCQLWVLYYATYNGYVSYVDPPWVWANSWIACKSVLCTLWITQPSDWANNPWIITKSADLHAIHGLRESMLCAQHLLNRSEWLERKSFCILSLPGGWYAYVNAPLMPRGQRKCVFWNERWVLNVWSQIIVACLITS